MITEDLSEKIKTRKFYSCSWSGYWYKSSYHFVLELFQNRGRYHIETSPLICSANQWTGFYMITASVLKGLFLLKRVFPLNENCIFSINCPCKLIQKSTLFEGRSIKGGAYFKTDWKGNEKIFILNDFICWKI